MSIFSSVKEIRHKKNAFNLSHDNMFTCDIGQVLPVFVHNDLLPNSDLRVSASQLSRFQAMLSPLQHKVDSYIHFWKIPYRLLDPNFPKFISGQFMREGGEYVPPSFNYAGLYYHLVQQINHYSQDVEYGIFDIPLFQPLQGALNSEHIAASYFFVSGGLLDMLGYPVFKDYEEAADNAIYPGHTDIERPLLYSQVSFTDRPLRSYAWLHAERYINENFQPAVRGDDQVPLYDFFYQLWSKSSGDISEIVADYLYFLMYQYKGFFFNHAYGKDYFTSSLPFVQVGDPVTLSLLGDAPVSGSATVPDGVGARVSNTSNPDYDGDNLKTAKYVFSVPAGHIAVPGANNLITVPSDNLVSETYKDYNGAALYPGSIVVAMKDSNDNTYYQSVPSGIQNFNQIEFVDSNGDPVSIDVSGTADLSEASAITINELRIANALQSLKEAFARYGTRFNEWLKGFWNQDYSDKTLQLPEWLGGGKVNIQISEIEQTSATSSESLERDATPLGTLAGKGSAMASGFAGFKTHIEEPSLIIGLFFIKPKSVYGNQGLNRHLTKLDDLFDFFNPKTEHLGEQAVKQSELYFTGNNTDVTFGYQSRYAEYKFWANEVHGQFMNYLDFWHLGRIFKEPPTLGNDFITINPEEQKRPFAVQQVDGADISNVMNWIHFEVHYLARMSHFGTPMLLN